MQRVGEEESEERERGKKDQEKTETCQVKEL